MAEETKPTTGLESPTPEATDNAGVSGGNPPAPAQTTFDQGALDAMKSENVELRTQLQKLQAGQKKAEEIALAEQGKFQELADKRAAENADLRTQLANVQKMNALQTAAQSAGLRSMSYLKLVDTNGLEITETGDVNGADAAIAALKESDPTLFGDSVKRNTVNTPSVAPGTGAASTIDPSKAYTADEISGMSDDQFQEYKTAKYGQKKQLI